MICTGTVDQGRMIEELQYYVKIHRFLIYRQWKSQKVSELFFLNHEWHYLAIQFLFLCRLLLYGGKRGSRGLLFRKLIIARKAIKHSDSVYLENCQKS